MGWGGGGGGLVYMRKSSLIHETDAVHSCLRRKDEVKD